MKSHQRVARSSETGALSPIAATGINGHARRTLPIDSPAQQSRTTRNPERKLSAMACRIASTVCASRPSGSSSPASSDSLERTSLTIFCGSIRSVRFFSKCESKFFTITVPNMAMARTPATRATALLIPDAVPAWRCATEFITTVVSGATVTAIPKPNTNDAGK